MSDMVGNPEDLLARIAAQIKDIKMQNEPHKMIT